MFDPVSLDPLTLLRQASLPIRATAGLLVAASAAVWVVGVFKLLQLSKIVNDYDIGSEAQAKLSAIMIESTIP